MSSYEVEHGVAKEKEQSSRRPDLSSFYSARNEAFGDRETNNTHASPTPANATGVFRLLADAFEVMLAEHGDNPVLSEMIGTLDDLALHPPAQNKGVPESFLTDLERVDKKKLKKDEVCPICNEPFLDDKYPLVVRLPCHPDHKFDLECISPWLLTNATCPLDRKVLWQKKAPPPKQEDEEEEYDTFYA